jgi:hypothetical protein
MSQDRKRSFVESPGGMALYLVISGWAAASTSSPQWVRLGWLVLFVTWAALLLRHLIRQRRRRKPALPDIHD